MGVPCRHSALPGFRRHGSLLFSLLVWRVLDFYLFLVLGAYLFLHEIQSSGLSGAPAGDVSAPSRLDYIG